jgi:hypothetical protein
VAHDTIARTRAKVWYPRSPIREPIKQHLKCESTGRRQLRKMLAEPSKLRREQAADRELGESVLRRRLR